MTANVERLTDDELGSVGALIVALCHARQAVGHQESKQEVATIDATIVE